MNEVKIDITITGWARSHTITGWARSHDPVDREYDECSADIEIKAVAEGDCESKVLIDLPLATWQLEQLQKALVQAAKGVRRVAREKQQAEAQDAPALSGDDLTREVERRLEDLVRKHRQRLIDLTVWYQEQRDAAVAESEGN